MKLYVTIVLIILTKFAFCQNKQFTVAQIDSIASVIDSTKKYDSSIVDGRIENTRKGVIKKIFKKRVIGGFSDYYFGNEKTKRLLKVIEEVEYTNFTRSSYYYENDSLIKVKITKRDIQTNKLITDGQYYFQQDSLIKKGGNDSLAKAFIILKNAKRFQERWASDQKTGLN